jgi:hypothetical protein
MLSQANIQRVVVQHVRDRDYLNVRVGDSRCSGNMTTYLFRD